MRTVKIALRKAVAADSDFAYGAKKAAFRHYAEKIWGGDEEAQREIHNERFQAQEFRVISAGGVDVGVMALEQSGDCVKLNQLYLLPEYQGRQIGRQSMLLVMEQARELGLPIRLRVLKNNPRARAFYERLGFGCVGETDTHSLFAWGE
jgi:GNAT superfamily N-acetyltransferase